MAVSVEGTGASTVLKIWRNPFGECPADWGPADWQFEDCGSCCIDGDNRFSGISAWGGQTPIVHTFDNYAQSDVAVVGCATDADCDNGQFCDGAETCDAVNDCQAGTPPVTDDGVSLHRWIAVMKSATSLMNTAERRQHATTVNSATVLRPAMWSTTARAGSAIRVQSGQSCDEVG